MCGCEDWLTCEHPWPSLAKLHEPRFRHVPGIPWTANGIAAIIDANALRAAYADVRVLTDDELDEVAHELFEAMEAESRKDLA